MITQLQDLMRGTLSHADTLFCLQRARANIGILPASITCNVIQQTLPQVYKLSSEMLCYMSNLSLSKSDKNISALEIKVYIPSYKRHFGQCWMIRQIDLYCPEYQWFLLWLLLDKSFKCLHINI